MAAKSVTGSNGGNLSAIQGIRSTNYQLILYPWTTDDGGNDNHVVVDARLKDLFADDLIYMDHDADLKEGGDAVKKHRHYILNFDNARFWTAIIKDIGIDINGQTCHFVQPLNRSGTLKDGLLYLTHIKFPWKQQYDPSAAVGSQRLKRLLYQYYDEYLSMGIPIQEQFAEIFRWIDSQDHDISYMDFGKWITGTRYYKLASNPLIMRILKEHNDEYLHPYCKDAYSDD